MRQRDRKKPVPRRRVLLASTAGAGVIAATVAALIIAGFPESPTTEPIAVSRGHAVTAARLALRETRLTLDPARFTGKAAAAYQVAREIPAVLDHLQCYCACGSEYGHVSLLSCYTDGHGST
jgi:hypothetical protein